MAVTIDRFELLPAPPPAPQATADQGAASASSSGGGASPPPPSRHELVRAMRLETARLARVYAH